jgi:FkbM family methyltransferase
LRGVGKLEMTAMISQATGRKSGVRLKDRLVSSALLAYMRHSPVERGKWRLMQSSLKRLIIELEPGLYIKPFRPDPVELDLIFKGTFEPETVEVFSSLLFPGMTVLDVGANIGLFTLVAAHRVGPGGRVHAFEPTPSLAKHLRGNLALNGLENVELNVVAVSDSVGQAVLHVTQSDNFGENTILHGVADAPGTAGLRVTTVTLDEYAARHSLGGVDVIKIDIEGAEPLALQGGRNLLSGDHAPILIVEANPRALAMGGSSLDELLGLIRSFGYTFYNIATYGRQTEDPWVNGLAAKPFHMDHHRALRERAWKPVQTSDVFGCN